MNDYYRLGHDIQDAKDMEAEWIYDHLDDKMTELLNDADWFDSAIEDDDIFEPLKKLGKIIAKIRPYMSYNISPEVFEFNKLISEKAEAKARELLTAEYEDRNE